MTLLDIDLGKLIREGKVSGVTAQEDETTYGSKAIPSSRFLAAPTPSPRKIPAVITWPSGTIVSASAGCS